MNKAILGGLVIGCITIAAATATAQTIRLKASIPFEFNVGAATFPAGDYTVTKAGQAALMVIEDNDSGRYRSVVIVSPAVHQGKQTSDDDSALVFNRVQDRYYFRQAWRAGDPLGAEAPVSRSEKQAMLRAATQPEKVVLRASLN